MAVLEVSRSVQRRRALAAELPTDHPECLDQIEALIQGLPDPELLCAEQRAGTLRAAQWLRNRLDAYMAGVAAQAQQSTAIAQIAARPLSSCPAGLRGV